MLREYSSPYNLGHKLLEEFFNGSAIHIQEKIDGSQISFGKDMEGNLHIRSRRRPIDVSNPGMFDKAVETVLRLEPDLQPGWTYRGEYLKKPKHNTLKYDRVPDGNIIIYDIDVGECDYILHNVLPSFALGLEVVPYFEHIKAEPTMEDLKYFLSFASILGGPMEGVVFKNYSLFGPDGKVVMAKHVSSAFKEQHSGDWKKRNPNRLDIIENIITQYKVEPRWRKAIYHLTEEGHLTHTSKDIGPLMKDLAADVEADIESDVKEILWNHFKKQIVRGIQKGFPEWYKEYLLEQQKENLDSSWT